MNCKKRIKHGYNSDWEQTTALLYVPSIAILGYGNTDTCYHSKFMWHTSIGTCCYDINWWSGVAKGEIKRYIPIAITTK